MNTDPDLSVVDRIQEDQQGESPAPTPDWRNAPGGPLIALALRIKALDMALEMALETALRDGSLSGLDAILANADVFEEHLAKTVTDRAAHLDSSTIVSILTSGAK